MKKSSQVLYGLDFSCRLRYNKSMKKWFPLFVFLLVVLLNGCGFGQPSLAGKKLSFETVDIDGNPVSSEELFARHEITMLNLWASWCGPCVGELSELNEVNDRLAQMDGAVVGLLNDDRSQKNLDTVKLLLDENNAGYLNILAPENMNEIIVQGSFPMTVFVDRDGVIVGRTLVGTVSKKYIVDYYLSAAEEALEALNSDAQE